MVYRQFNVAWVFVMAMCGFARHGIAADATTPTDVAIPVVSGLDIKMGDTVVIMRGASYPSAFRFADGRIAVSGDMGFKGGESCWSADGGRTWKIGMAGPSNACLDLGKGEVLSLNFKTDRGPDNKLRLPQMRSRDDWRTVEPEYSIVFYNGPNWGASSSYNTVMEVSPDTLLVVYDRLVEGGDPKANVWVHKDQFEIVGTFFSVKKK
jgi:hypothetical protein